MFRKTVCVIVIAAASASAISQSLLNPAYTAETFATGIAAPVTMAVVGPEEFFICEKPTGIVKHRRRGQWLDDLIDLNVAGGAELGLLGICLDPDYAISPFVYLFYASASIDGEEWIEDRVDKYLVVGSRLRFVKNVWKSPYDPNQNNGTSHHGGVIAVGPDRKLYICYGDLGRGRFDDPRIETNTGMNAASGSGSIYRVNLDGTTPNDNPFAGSKIPELRNVWAFGIRNSFGIAFDPFSDNVWFTENGPDAYDELNLGFPGMNSGWLKITGPDSRDARYFENEYHAYESDELSNIQGSRYSDPAFSWLTTIAPTAIVFPNTPKFSVGDQNLMLVTDANNGNIYAFDLSFSRNRIEYKSGTTDTVADTDAERDQYLFGSGFGLVSDAKLGIDGYLYIVDLGQGRVIRVRPVQELESVQAVSLRKGKHISGTVGSFSDSDDDRYVLEAAFTPVGDADSVSVELKAHADTALFKKLSLQVETSAPDIHLYQTIELYNTTFRVWMQVDSRTITEAESETTVDFLGIAQHCIDPDTGEIRVRITARPSGMSLFPNWQWQADKVSFVLNAN